MKPRTQPIMTDAEIAELNKSLEFIDNETQKILDHYDRQPAYASVLRKLANNYTMMSRIHSALENHEQATQDERYAMDMLGRIGGSEQNSGDFYKIAEFYHHLAKMHAKDKALAAIFKFGCDFFSGSDTVCFSSLNAVINACRKQSGSNLMCNSALSQLIKLIRSKYTNDQLPASVLKNELKELYYQKRLETITQELEKQADILLDLACDEIQVLIDEMTAPQAHADVEMRVTGFKQPVRAKASAGGMFAPDVAIKPGHVAELVTKMKAFPIMK